MWASTKLVALGALALSTLSSAMPAVHKRGCGVGVCEFDSANSPKCWGNTKTGANYSLETNYYDEIPETGVTREYWFDVQNKTGSLDGVERVILTINGSAPGPTIYANWGDWVVIHVKNSLANNGTSIHWHGIRQLETSQQDGVASITQCPTAPGDTTTYRWRATQYGHTWYHSHFAVQAWNGVFGGIIINGPASAPYDDDKGILFLNDWHHLTTDQIWGNGLFGPPPAAQNALINGTNVYGDGGARFETEFISGTRHRLRIVNGAIDTHFKFSIDGHSMTVIANDLVAIEPYNTTVLSVAIGQRYDVIVEANQAVGDYWMRANIDTACSATNDQQDNILGIVRYDTSSTALPTTTGYAYTNDCMDESMEDLVPYLIIDADEASVSDSFSVAFDFSTGLTHWTINGTPFHSTWNTTTLEQAIDDVTVFETAQQVIQLDEENVWVYFVIQSALAVPHPIHLHGHDFLVLAQETNAVYDPATVKLTTTNPPRRDVAILPTAGYLVIGFITDNPGVWLMHCHIGWHAAEGFALQLIERSSEIAATVDAAALHDTCDKWDAYINISHQEQDDSGI